MTHVERLQRPLFLGERWVGNLPLRRAQAGASLLAMWKRPIDTSKEAGYIFRSKSDLSGVVLDVKYNSKTLGPRSARLVTELNDRRKSTFTISDVVDITRLPPASARALVHKARQRGVMTRLKPGLYSLVPFELGKSTEHVDHPCLIAAEMVEGGSYFLSHGTAMELHRMVTQPHLTVHVSCTRRIRPQTVGGHEFRFIHLKPKHVFGEIPFWVTPSRTVMVSDPERTIIDGLLHPALVGGITEVAKGIWMKRESLDAVKMVEYADRLEVGAVFRRLGFLLEHYGLADEAVLNVLQQKLTATYQRFDPLFLAEGPHISRWRLQLNVSAEELDAVRLN